MKCYNKQSGDIILPIEKHTGWNAFHYFNYHYRQKHTISDDNVTMNEVREAWSEMDQVQRQPFFDLQKENMCKYRKRGSFKDKNKTKHKRRPSASSVMKKRLSLLEYGPQTDENWNTWASRIQKQMILHFHNKHPEFKTHKEATYEWQIHWLSMKPVEQGEELREFFKDN